MLSHSTTSCHQFQLYQLFFRIQNIHRGNIKQTNKTKQTSYILQVFLLARLGSNGIRTIISSHTPVPQQLYHLSLCHLTNIHDLVHIDALFRVGKVLIGVDSQRRAIGRHNELDLGVATEVVNRQVRVEPRLVRDKGLDLWQAIEFSPLARHQHGVHTRLLSQDHRRTMREEEEGSEQESEAQPGGSSARGRWTPHEL